MNFMCCQILKVFVSINLNNYKRQRMQVEHSDFCLAFVLWMLLRARRVHCSLLNDCIHTKMPSTTLWNSSFSCWKQAIRPSASFLPCYLYSSFFFLPFIFSLFGDVFTVLQWLEKQEFVYRKIIALLFICIWHTHRAKTCNATNDNNNTNTVHIYNSEAAATQTASKS